MLLYFSIYCPVRPETKMNEPKIHRKSNIIIIVLFWTTDVGNPLHEWDNPELLQALIWTNVRLK